MKKSILLVAISVLLSAFTSIVHAQIIADHTVVDQYDQIPDYYLNEVKKMWLNLVGESHSRGYRNGMQLLAAQNPRFAASITVSGEPEAYTDQHLRVSNIYHDRRSYWNTSAGEEDFWTSDTAIDMMKNHLSYMRSSGNPVSGFGLGWCWDMTRGTPSSQADSLYGVRWYGSARVLDGSDQTWFGLDADDNFDGSHALSLQDYLDAVAEYQQYDPQTVTFYTTGPVDGGGNTGEPGYQRYIKHQMIRQHVNTTPDAVLFDYADILCWNDDGEQRTIEWDGHVYPAIHLDNATFESGDDDHIGDAGAIRVAKAMWWMLARVAGWDGSVTDKVNMPVALPVAGTYTNPVEVTLSSATDGSAIYYTLDGSDPTTSSIPYTGPISISSSATIMAKAFKDGMTTSDSYVGNYIIDIDTTAPEAILASAENATTVQILFNEPLDEASISSLSNYSLSPSVSVNAASLSTDGLTITLVTEALTSDIEYNLTLNNLFDLFSNEINPDSVVAFTYTPSVTPDSLQQQWSFESTAEVDAYGVEVRPNGKSGNAFYFPGTESYVGLGTGTHNIDQTNEFTIAMWINYEEALSGNLIIRGSYVYPYRLTTSGNYLRNVIRTNRTNYVRGTIPLMANTWYHVALTYRDGHRAMYVNGEIDEQNTITGTPFFRDDAQEIKVGEGFQGLIDEVQIYNEALTQVQIQNLYSGDIDPVAQQPEISPAAGTYETAIEVTLSSATDGAAIYYTTDGTEPDASSTEYTEPFSIFENTTVKAIAVCDGYVASQTGSVEYLFDIDTSGPVLTSSNLINGSMLELVFDEAISEITAETVANYTVEPFAEIVSVKLQSDQKTINVQFESIIENHCCPVNFHTNLI